MRTFAYCSLIWLILFCGMCSLAFGQSTEYAPGQILIKFKTDKTTIHKNTLKSTINARSLKAYPRTGVELWEIENSQNIVDVEVLVSQYRNHPDIEFVEPNYRVSIGTTVPNDPGFGNLWGLNNVGQGNGAQDADIDAPEAWDITTGSPSEVVAIIDTGIDWKHPDLVNNIWQNLGEDADGDGKVLEWNGSKWIFDPGDINNMDDDGNGYQDDFIGWDFRNNDNNPYDDHYHGTHVAGTVGAEGDNDIGITGVTWDVQLAALKFLSGTGSGNISDALEALNYCITMNIRISNNSWGGGSYSTALYQALQDAEANGHLFVAAAGNSSRNNDNIPAYPASYNLSNIISVAATTRYESISSFSNYGLTTVDLGAPGSDIYSCMPNNGYASKNGTSMASPHVTGACALLWGLCPSRTYAQIKSAILNSTDPILALAGKTVSGGRLNVHQALLTCSSTPPTTCRYNDSLALVALYNATNGNNWTNSWNLNQSMPNWHGVTLGTNGCLKVLDLNNNNLVGNIPTSIGELQDCVYLNLSINQLSSSIPNTIGNLQNLGFLNLRTNQLSGNIPPEIGNLQGVTFLALNNNQLSDGIPMEMAGMQSLGLLYLNNNSLNGCYASELSALCSKLYNSSNANISAGNNFNVAWESFCSSQAGNCDGPVWPGDADADGEVTEADFLILAIALAQSSSGPARLNASTNWFAQPCPDWSRIIEGVNGKHQDCDGDGVVDADDNLVITANFEKTVGTSSRNYLASTLNYRLEPLPPISGYLRYELSVEDAQGNPISAHGISCSLNMSNDISVDNIQVDVSNSSLNPTEVFEIYNTEENKLSVAFTRTDGINQLCDGPIATFIVVTNDLPDGEPFSLDIDGGAKVEFNGDTENAAGMTINDIYTGTQPNSNTLIITASAIHAQCNTLGEASVSPFGGISPYTYAWNTGETTRVISNLTAGLYEVTVTDDSGLSEVITTEVEGIFIPLEDEFGNLIDCAYGDDCPTLIVHDNTIPTGTYQAETAINSQGTVNEDANVQFKAGTSVILDNGFTVPANAQFSGEIEDCQ